jgi:hypothetical protein
MNLIDILHAAFDGVPFPGPESRTLRQAEAWDHYDEIDASKDWKGRWQELPAADIRACQQALPHLDEYGLRYYLPALMCHYLLHTEERTRWGFHSLLYTLGPPGDGLSVARKQRLSLLTDDQRRAIAMFVVAVEAEEDILVMWRKWLSAAD